MAEPPASDDRRAARLERLVRRLLKGRRLKVTPADADEREAIMAAARLAGSREARPHMSPAFRRRLAAQVGAARPAQRPGWLTRRTALGGAVGLAAGILAGAGGGEALQALRTSPPAPLPTAPPGVTPPPRPVFQPAESVARWSGAGLRLSDLVEGVPRKVAAGSVEAFVVRRGDDVSAMSAYCTHFPCELVWKQDQRVLLCPCHDRAFDAAGESTDAAYPLPPLPLVQARVRDGMVEVLGT